MPGLPQWREFRGEQDEEFFGGGAGGERYDCGGRGCRGLGIGGRAGVCNWGGGGRGCGDQDVGRFRAVGEAEDVQVAQAGLFGGVGGGGGGGGNGDAGGGAEEPV